MEPTSDPDNTHVSSSACDMLYCGVSAPLRNASEDGKSEEEDTCVYWVSAPLRNASEDGFFIHVRVCVCVCVCVCVSLENTSEDGFYIHVCVCVCVYI